MFSTPQIFLHPYISVNLETFGSFTFGSFTFGNNSNFFNGTLFYVYVRAFSAQVVIEISTDPIELTYFSVFSEGSVSSTATGLISMRFTVSSVALPTSIAALAITFLSLLLSLMGLDIGVG